MPDKSLANTAVVRWLTGEGVVAAWKTHPQPPNLLIPICRYLWVGAWWRTGGWGWQSGVLVNHWTAWPIFPAANLPQQ